MPTDPVKFTGSFTPGSFFNKQLYLTASTTKEDKANAPILKKLSLSIDQDFDEGRRKYDFEVVIRKGDTPYLLTGQISFDEEALKEIERLNPNINSAEKAVISALIAFNDLQKEESFLGDLKTRGSSFSSSSRLEYEVAAAEFTITLNMTKSGVVAKSNQLFGEKEVIIPFDRFSEVPEVVALHLRELSKILDVHENVFQTSVGLCNELGRYNEYIKKSLEKVEEIKGKTTKLKNEIDVSEKRKKTAKGDERIDIDIDIQIQQKKSEIEDLQKERDKYLKKCSVPAIDTPDKAGIKATVTGFVSGLKKPSWTLGSGASRVFAHKIQTVTGESLYNAQTIRDNVVASYKRLHQHELDLKEAKRDKNAEQIQSLEAKIQEERSTVIKYREKLEEIDILCREQLLPALLQLPGTMETREKKQPIPLEDAAKIKRTYPLQGRVSAG